MNGVIRSVVTSAPFTSPQRRAAPEARPRRRRSRARPRASRARTTTVESATVEPTERSMPPSRMTSVMPIAAIPTTTVCRAIVVRFCARGTGRARGSRRARTRRRRPRAGRGTGTYASSFMRRLLCSSITRARSSSSRHGPRAAELAPAHHRDAVADRRAAPGRARHHEHGLAARREPVDERVDLGAAADVDAARRLVEQEHVDVVVEQPRERDLLLVAARERADGLIGAARRRRRGVSIQRAAAARDPRRRDEPERAERSRAARA